MNKNFIAEIFKSEKTVFNLKELSYLTNERNYKHLKSKVNYYVRKKMLRNIRRGIYVKENYNPHELAVKIYTPSYISFETILFQEGIIFQYSKITTIASYLSREIKVDHINLKYRKIKDSILLAPGGIISKENFNISVKERAFLDMLYIDQNFYFDNLKPLNKKKVLDILKIYNNSNLENRVKELLNV